MIPWTVDTHHPPGWEKGRRSVAKQYQKCLTLRVKCSATCVCLNHSWEERPTVQTVSLWWNKQIVMDSILCSSFQLLIQHSLLFFCGCVVFCTFLPSSTSLRIHLQDLPGPWLCTELQTGSTDPLSSSFDSSLFLISLHVWCMSFLSYICFLLYPASRSPLYII